MERYGKPEVVEARAPAEMKHIYRVGGMTITTELIDGKIAVILYAKKRGAPFAPEEIKAHTVMNGAGKPWGEMSLITLPFNGGKIYKWVAQDRAAQYFEGTRLLALTPIVYAEKRLAAAEGAKGKAEDDRAGDQPEKQDMAIAALRRVVASAPDNPKGHGDLGVALYEQGKLDEAVASLLLWRWRTGNSWPP